MYTKAEHYEPSGRGFESLRARHIVQSFNKRLARYALAAFCFSTTSAGLSVADPVPGRRQQTATQSGAAAIIPAGRHRACCGGRFILGRRFCTGGAARDSKAG